MHKTSLDSPRLQRVLKLLQDGNPHTTRDIMLNADVCAVSTCIKELRDSGYRIECKCIGRGKYEYSLLPF